MERNQLKTFVLLSFLSGLLLFAGYIMGGNAGIFVALLFSLIMNTAAFFYSDKYVLTTQGAEPLSKERYPEVYQMVEELAKEYRIPMPKLWRVPTRLANAFATGRNPKNGHVAVTQGILEILEPRELRGVLAHELGHIKNRDILVSSIAATIAGAIGMLANSLRWQGYAAGDKGAGLGNLFIALLMPIVASIIHMGISRSREYLADDSGAHTSKDPLALASALQKLQLSVKDAQLIAKDPAQAATASLYIVYPFTANTLNNLFSTHPPTEERVARLRALAKEISNAS